MNLPKQNQTVLAPITPAFLKRLNANADAYYWQRSQCDGRFFDSSKGEFRLCGVTAGVGGHSYMNYLKVPAKVDELCAILKEKQKESGEYFGNNMN